MHDPTYRQYAITFVENHDMQYRSEKEPLDPLKRDTLAANAYMLAMPGTPCVFQPHWRAYKKEIKSMIEARKLAGITNMSNYTNKMAQIACFANETTGDKAKLIVVVGNNTKAYTPSADYAQILEGYHYRYYLSKSAETAWCNIPSGEYEAGFKAKLTAVSQNSNAKLVYTTDGTAPTAKRRTPVLDRTWIYIRCLLSPLLTLRSEELEWSTVELYESLADNWLVGTVTTLDVHHHCDRHTTCNPLCCRSCCILDD